MAIVDRSKAMYSGVVVVDRSGASVMWQSSVCGSVIP